VTFTRGDLVLWLVVVLALTARSALLNRLNRTSSRERTPMAITHREINVRFAGRPGAGGPELELTGRLRSLAHLALTVVPGSREQTLAVTGLEEALLWSRAGIDRAPARQRRDDPEGGHA
jgi:hypothetical protein